MDSHRSVVDQLSYAYHLQQYSRTYIFHHSLFSRSWHLTSLAAESPIYGSSQSPTIDDIHLQQIQAQSHDIYQHSSTSQHQQHTHQQAYQPHSSHQSHISHQHGHPQRSTVHRPPSRGMSPTPDIGTPEDDYMRTHRRPSHQGRHMDLEAGPSSAQTEPSSSMMMQDNVTTPAAPTSVTVSSDQPLDEEPLYVNAKQYYRILKRRVARARLEELHRLSRQRKVSILTAFLPSTYSERYRTPFQFSKRLARKRRSFLLFL